MDVCAYVCMEQVCECVRWVWGSAGDRGAFCMPGCVRERYGVLEYVRK